MLFFDVCLLCSVVFRHGIDNWNGYFGIGIFEVELELVCCSWCVIGIGML